MCPANERRRYNVTSSLIGWAHVQNDPFAINTHVHIIQGCLSAVAVDGWGGAGDGGGGVKRNGGMILYMAKYSQVPL